MMASEENLFSPTMPRQMPVLAQSTAPDNSLQITVTSQSTAQNGSLLSQGPLLAQLPPVFGLGDEFLDPLDAVKQGKPFDPSNLGKQPNYGSEVGPPPQEPASDPSMTPANPPQGVPQGGFWFQFWYLASKFFNSFSGSAPAVSPICTTPLCQA
jgi:hypothetical protein